MQKKPAQDRKLSSIVGIVLVVLAAGFAIGWFYLRHEDRQATQINYLRLPEVAISRDGHSIRASFAFRTSAADADWVARNRPALEQVMKQVLLAVDPVQVRAPDGLREFQGQLRDATNGALQSSRIQEVLVTDFLVSEGDW
ncbi:MAG TPA: flagellar basal body-associated FliL family protein [Noviherbaspirillum sp.]|uniref:flagellar basal body-associated FliL family protein n=1 Tax=Noviherbaspirillum sp. TaxID=1926288 RepID=UPI002D2B45A8|nr:flagellar basal body-associated FliL family protein [Noviherbaspirillum sp.]HYD94777.1 flagellar basal body-associated FliL family protein [Noviherbaspirillum sp.]